MSYNRGPDSVSHSQADSTTTNPFIISNSSGLFGHPSTSLASSLPPTFEPFEEAMSYDEDIAAGSRCNERLQWADMDCRIAPPISSARSFIDRTPLRPSDPELSWSGTHARYHDIYGQEPLQSPSNSYNEHVPLPYLQPHVSHRTRSTRTVPFSSSAASTSSTTSSSILYQTLLPPISTVSPYASSDSSSSSSSPLSTPEITIRTPITVHQPRPSRRIPIISLSELASACDDFTTSPVSKDVSYQKPFRELLSPLTTNSPADYTPPYSPMHSFLFSEEMGAEGTPFPVPFAFEEKNAYTAPIHMFNDSKEVVICSCGCMGSYIIPQSL